VPEWIELHPALQGKMDKNWKRIQRLWWWIPGKIKLSVSLFPLPTGESSI